MKSGIDQRMELLRGLMDTDGHSNTRGTAVFTNNNMTLAYQVYELAVSLGLRPRIRRYQYLLKKNKYNIPYYYSYWKVSMQSFKDRRIFHIKRKFDRAISKYTHRNTRLIKSMEKTASVPTRCIQVEGGMYLAGKELIPTHNSTIITFAKNIQDVIIDSDETVGIFSHTRPIAKAFLKQIMRELEDNEYLKSLFPDIFYWEPWKESPSWSIDNGIIVKRKGNPKECTFEAWGLVDGQPTSKHFRILDYDDVVTKESVNTPDQIKNCTQAWELSLNLGARNGRIRVIGTRYHYSDTYRTMIERNAVKLRVYPATVDGTVNGEPVLLTRDELRKKRDSQGPYTFSCQMLQNPVADSAMGFNEIWLRHYDRLKDMRGWNIYIIVDPAGEKKKENDYTVMMVIALSPDGNYYLIDGLRDRLNLTQRTKRLFNFVRKYKPLAVGYEKYGMQCDIEHIQERMEHENYRFKIIPLGGQTSKNDRIRKLIPVFEQGRMIMPHRLLFSDYEDRLHDMIQEFITDEYLAFPACVHDDMFDCMARILEDDLGTFFPELEEHEIKKAPKPYDPLA
ncbi:MAG: LAGLIDADG family homing endonuclease [Victivallales bacterium]